MSELIHLCIIFRLCCCYSVSQDVSDCKNQKENMDLEHELVRHAKWKVFLLEVKSCLSAIYALGFLCMRQTSCCSSENCRKNVLKEHKPSTLCHCQKE